jgi:hypothetical protein
MRLFQRRLMQLILSQDLYISLDLHIVICIRTVQSCAPNASVDVCLLARPVVNVFLSGTDFSRLGVHR